MTLQEEIQNGESRTLEYKATLPHDSQKWIKTIVAFANGGWRQICAWRKQSTRICRACKICRPV